MKICPFCEGTGKMHVVKQASPMWPKPEPRAKSKARKQRTHKATTSAIRAAVMERAKWLCEACGKATTALELDHFKGGSNRRSMQSVASCWALCGGNPESCHALKTRNAPSLAWWNGRFRAHATKHDLPILTHLVKPPRPSKAFGVRP